MSSTRDTSADVAEEPLVPTAYALPTDPLFSSQFNLLNTGQTGGIAGIDLNVTGAWDDYTGRGVVVGIIDDGVSHTHPDLAANYDTSIDNDARGNDGDAMAEGSDAHGTAVAGIIAADDNGFGSVGVAFDATIAGFRMGFGADGTLGQITENLRLQSNVDISNNSWGFGGFFSDNFKSAAFAPHAAALEDAVATGRDGLGTVWVFAAGNSRADGDDVNYHNFQNSRFTIAVAAAEDDGDITFYSTPGAAVITTAPVAAGGGSGGVITTDREGSAGYVSGDFVNGFNGTSAAAPMISGVAALILEANPDLGYRDVQQILAYSSRRIVAGDSGWALNAAGDWNGGGLHVSHDFGFGLVDALAAVRLAESWRDQSTHANEFSVGASRSPFLTIANNATVTDTITITDAIDLEWVEVDINIDHSWIGDLVVTLTSPDGTTSTLVDRPGRHTSGWGTGQDDINFVLTSARHWGEDAVGDWTLSISDHYAEDSGRLLSWSLDLYGDPADGDDDYIYTDEYGVFAAGDAQRRTLIDNGGSDRINAAALTAAALIDLTPGAAGAIAGQTFTIADGTVIEDAIAGDGDDTLLGNAVANDLNGGRGDDVLDGGAGDDTLTGGAGADLFRITVGEGGDTITDFDVSLDALELGGSGTIRSADDFVAAGADGAQGFDVTLDDGAILSLLGVLAADLGELLISFVDAPEPEPEPEPEPLIDIFLAGGDLPETLAGTEGADTILGGGGGDRISGLAGADSLLGEAGDDEISGGDGNDTIRGGAGLDLLRGDGGDDILLGDDGNDHLEGGDGNDRLLGGEGTDTLFGGSGHDNITGGNGNDSIHGDGGNDRLDGEAGNDIVRGGDGDDTIYGGAGNDILLGDAGANLIYGGDNDDRLVGGTGDDSLHGGNGADNITGGAGHDSLLGEAGNDRLDGEAGNDTVRGGDGDDTIFGGAGDDILLGDAGADLIYGGDGEDTIYGGVANDTIRGGDGRDEIHGEAGADMLFGGADADRLFGGDGNDRMLGGTGADTLFGGGDDDNITAGEGNDLVYGGAGDDTLDGEAGDDLIFGGAGNDTVKGGDGADRILGEDGNDILLGEGGDDNLTGEGGADSLRGGDGNDRLDGGTGDDSLFGDAGNDTLYGADGADLLYGGADNDFLFGGDGADWLSGGLGDDTLYGGADDDTLMGQEGNDRIFGGTGMDLVYGGAGDDTLTGNAGDTLIGGEGQDRFIFETGGTGLLTIVDFEDGFDRLDLRGAGSADIAIEASGSHTHVQIDGEDAILLLSIAAHLFDADDMIV